MFDEHRNRSACVYETRPRNTHHRKACCVGEYGNWCVEVAEFVSHLFSSSTKDPSRAPSFESHVKEQGHTGNVGLSTTVYVGFRPPYTSCVGAGHYHMHRPDWRTRRTPSNDMGQGGRQTWSATAAPSGLMTCTVLASSTPWLECQLPADITHNPRVYCRIISAPSESPPPPAALCILGRVSYRTTESPDSPAPALLSARGSGRWHGTHRRR